MILFSEIIVNLCFIIFKKYFKNTGFPNNISLYFHLHDKIHTIEAFVFFTLKISDNHVLKLLIGYCDGSRDFGIRVDKFERSFGTEDPIWIVITLPFIPLPIPSQGKNVRIVPSVPFSFPKQK